MYNSVPKLFSLIQSTAQGSFQLYNWQSLSSVKGGAVGATAVWGPVAPNPTGGAVNIYVQVSSVYASVYGFDILGIYKSFDKTNWFVHTVFTSHPNLGTATGAKQNWVYHDANLDALYHRIQYVYRASRRATSTAVTPRIAVRAFSETVNKY